MIDVWVTAAGDRYHTSPDCLALQAGQEGGRVQGYELRDIDKVDLDKARAFGRSACAICGTSRLA